MTTAHAALAIAVAAACGDNAVPVLERSHDLVVVAHQDDDLIFIQPDLTMLVRARQPITVVYITAGDGGNGLVFAAARKRAVMNAYGTVAGSSAWTCATVDLADHAVETCSLVERPVTLVFLGYPDGGIVGELPASLLRLWEGTIAAATTISDAPTTYDREGLIRVVAAIVRDTQPAVVRTLEISGMHGDDHSDHMMVGALTELAVARATSPALLLSYRGYNIGYEPANVSEEVFAETSLFLRAYMACLITCGVCGETPCPTVDDPRYANFLHRRYVVPMLGAPLVGALTSSVGCLNVEGDRVVVGTCTAMSPDVALETPGMIRVSDSCLEVRDRGRIGLGACDPDPDRYFQLDAEGHLWSGLPPARTHDMLYDHGTCVYGEGGEVVAGLCGAHRDWRWQLVP